MRTSRKESSGGVLASRSPATAARQAAMAEGPHGAGRAEAERGTSVLHSQALLSLMGGECLQILRCRICMEFFSIPIVLPCGHTFCLHCLTELCKNASRGSMPNSRHELLIGCPNCHVQIFAKPILERNVTCNFIIQSLVETLRNRKIPKRHEISVNTEQSHVGPWVRAVSEEELSGVLRDVDRLAAAVSSRSVVDDAFFEIESLRNEYLASKTAISPASCTAVHTPNKDRRQNSAAVPSNSGFADIVRSSSCSSNVHTQRTSAKTMCGPSAKSYASTLSSWPSTSSTYTSSLHTTASPSGSLSYGDRNGNNVETAKELNSLDIIVTSERKLRVGCEDFILFHGDKFVNSSTQSFATHWPSPLPFGVNISRHSTSGLLTKKDEDTRCFISRSEIESNCQCQDESTALEKECEEEEKQTGLDVIRQQENQKCVQELISGAGKSQAENDVGSAVIQNALGGRLAPLKQDVHRGRSRQINGYSRVSRSCARASSPCDWPTRGGGQGVSPKKEAVDGTLGDDLCEYRRGGSCIATLCCYFPFSSFEVSSKTRAS